MNAHSALVSTDCRRKRPLQMSHNSFRTPDLLWVFKTVDIVTLELLYVTVEGVDVLLI